MADNIVSLQIADKTKERLERLSETMHRISEALAAEAQEAYLSAQEWQIAGIDEAVRLADDGKFVSHEAMSAWLTSWGTDEETEPPQRDIVKGLSSRQSSLVKHHPPLTTCIAAPDGAAKCNDFPPI